MRTWEAAQVSDISPNINLQCACVYSAMMLCTGIVLCCDVVYRYRITQICNKTGVHQGGNCLHCIEWDTCLRIAVRVRPLLP